MGRGDKIPITSERSLSFEGYFELDQINNHIKEYLEDTRHYDTSLRDLVEKNVDGKRSIVIKMDAEQQFNDYYMINIRYVIDANGKETEIEVNGKKKVVQKGKATIQINSYIEPDYLNKRDQGAVGMFVGKLWDRFLGKKELNECISSANHDVGGMIGVFKREVNSKLK